MQTFSNLIATPEHTFFSCDCICIYSLRYTKLHLLQPPDGFELALITALASYVNYPIFGDEERTSVIQCLAALARAAAGVPSICFAACLPQLGGEEDLPESTQLLKKGATIQTCNLEILQFLTVRSACLTNAPLSNLPTLHSLS